MMTDDTINTDPVLPLKEYYSFNQNYKALIQKSDKIEHSFDIFVYKWNIDKTDDDGKPLWEKVAGPFCLDTIESAEIIAREHLRLLAGEVLEEVIDKMLLDWTASFLGHDDFSFLKPENFKVKFIVDIDKELYEFIEEPQKVLFVDDLYFVESKDGKNWFGGFLYDEGQIRCWQKFETLQGALEVVLSLEVE